jgi:hypothetical protein
MCYIHSYKIYSILVACKCNARANVTRERNVCTWRAIGSVWLVFRSNFCSISLIFRFNNAMNALNECHIYPQCLHFPLLPMSKKWSQIPLCLRFFKAAELVLATVEPASDISEWLLIDDFLSWHNLHNYLFNLNIHPKNTTEWNLASHVKIRIQSKCKNPIVKGWMYKQLHMRWARIKTQKPNNEESNV